MTGTNMVTIFLENGTMHGTRTFEIGNWNGTAHAIYKNDLPSFFKETDIDMSCVYVLVSSCKTKVYVGESEEIKTRLLSHVKKKDFWEQVIFFTGPGLNKAHVR